MESKGSLHIEMVNNSGSYAVQVDLKESIFTL